MVAVISPPVAQKKGEIESRLLADSTPSNGLTVTLLRNLPAAFVTKCSIAIATVATVVVNHGRRRGRRKMTAAISKSLAAREKDGKKKGRQ
jgi:hypothetical protein